MDYVSNGFILTKKEGCVTINQMVESGEGYVSYSELCFTLYDIANLKNIFSKILDDAEINDEMV
jgi:hypothetical protein